MADREHLVSLARQPEGHRPAEAAQPAGDDRITLFHHIPFFSARYKEASGLRIELTKFFNALVHVRGFA